MQVALPPARLSGMASGFSGPRPGRGRRLDVRVELRIFSPTDVKATSYVCKHTLRQPGGQGPPALAWAAAEQQQEEEESPGGVTFRVFEGEVVSGPLAGTRVELKAWPHPDYSLADALAANEVAAHDALTTPAGGHPRHVQRLLGGFVAEEGASAGEQWLVLEACPGGSAEQWALAAAAATPWPAPGGAGPSPDLLAELVRRGGDVREAMRQALAGLAALHARGRLHQWLGPAALALDPTPHTPAAGGGAGGRAEGEGQQPSPSLVATLRGLHLSVDVGDEALFGGATLGEIWDRGAITADAPTKALAAGLWRRARAAGAWSEADRRAFGLADDVAMAGWLLAYLAFVPLSAPGSVDGPTLQRLFALTFKLDLAAAREYCEDEDRWAGATALLAARGGAGWDLLSAMLSPDWATRPSAAQCLEHPFFARE